MERKGLQTCGQLPLQQQSYPFNAPKQCDTKDSRHNPAHWYDQKDPGQLTGTMREASREVQE